MHAIKEAIARNIRPKELDKFIEVLKETCNVSAAAKAALTDRSSLYALRKLDPEFAKQWDDALEEAYDGLEAEARRRAFAGYTSKWEPDPLTGERIEIERKYSDSLAALMLGSYRSKFRPSSKMEVTGAEGAPLQGDDGQVAARVATILEAARVRKAAADDGSDLV